MCITLVAAYDGLAQPVSQKEVIWNGLGKAETTSMSLGNGDIAVNARTEENGDLVLLIAKLDTWSENAQLLKVGRIRMKLSPNPLIGNEGLIQRLTINDACIEVKAGGKSISLWVDANQPVIHLTTITEHPEPKDKWKPEKVHYNKW